MARMRDHWPENRLAWRLHWSAGMDTQQNDYRVNYSLGGRADYQIMWSRSRAPSASDAADYVWSIVRETEQIATEYCGNRPVVTSCDKVRVSYPSDYPTTPAEISVICRVW